MMAKPIRALEMHYPVIQFLIIIPLFHRRDIVGRFRPFNQNFRKFVSSGKWYRNFLKKFPEIPEKLLNVRNEIIQPKVLEIRGAKLNGKKTSGKNCRKFGYTSQGCPLFGNF